MIRAEQVVEAAPYAMVMIGRDGKIKLVNTEAERLFGYTRTELLGQKAEMLVPECFRSCLPELRTALAADPELREVEVGRGLHGIKKDGSGFPVEIRINPFETDEGTMALAAIADISARIRAEQLLEERAAELTRSNQELERFALIASHDLRAPLRAIKNLAEWIGEYISAAGSHEAQANLLLLRARMERLDGLLSGLLEYSRVGKTNTPLELVDTEWLVAEIVEYVSPRPGFAIECLGPMPKLRTVKAPLVHVLLNLISNALKHHDREQGTIAISARDLGTNIEFTVFDDGPGIDPAFHDRIFGIFQTLKPRDEVEGSGIGLAIVKKEIEANGGAVKVVSAPPGRGTAFVFNWMKTES
jgi:PAS domain S-box-containing protein